MDIVLSVCDTLLLDSTYAVLLPAAVNATAPLPAKDLFSEYYGLEPSPIAHGSTWARNDIRRQFMSLFLITWVFGFILYCFCSTIAYVFLFDKSLEKHPKFLRNQKWLEIKQSISSMPTISLLTTPFFLAEVRGYSKIYLTPSLDTWTPPILLQIAMFLVFTDFGIYSIHRVLHNPKIYKYIHKTHHRWIVPTPFAAVAFHPVDAWLQSTPYHFFPFLFPMHKLLYLAFFVSIQVWTVSIHDNFFIMDNPFVNGTACHTLHHLYFNYNYGQFFTLWDRIGGSYRRPDKEVVTGAWAKDNKNLVEMEKMIGQVEGGETREYITDKKLN